METMYATEVIGSIDVQSLNMTVRYCAVAASALLIWHHLLTLEKEVTFFWKRRPSGACALFFANRYLALAFSMYDLFREPRIGPGTECTASDTSVQIGVYLSQYVIWTAFSCLRVYALRRRRVSAILVLVLSLVPSAIYAIQYHYGDSTLVPFVGCMAGSTTPLAIRLSLSIVARTSIIIADIIVVAFTWATTHRHHKSRVLGVASTLASVLYKNGAMYFIVLTTINVLYMVSYTLALASGTTAVRASFFYSVINDTFTRLTAILMTHFLIELQEAATDSTQSSAHSTLGASQGSLGILQFARADVDHWIQEQVQSRSAIDVTTNEEMPQLPRDMETAGGVQHGSSLALGSGAKG